MKKFSSIENSLKTNYDHIIQDMVVKTGLVEEKIKRLYENFSFQTNGDISEIQNKFNSMITLPKVKDSIEKEINDELEKKNFQKVLELLNQITDTSKMFKLMSIVLTKLDIDDRFKNIIPEISASFEMTELMESSKVSYINNITGGTEVKQTIDLYSNLKTILSRNNRRWGNNYHLDNVYKSIWEYLDAEIEYLTSKNDVVTVTENFHDELLKNIMFGNVNPMHKHIDILRTLVPDIQTLVFDLVAITTEYIKLNQMALSYLSIDTWNQYFSATEKLYAKILSSREISRVLYPPMTQKEKEAVLENQIKYEKEYPGNKYVETDEYFIYNLPWNHQKFDIYLRPIQFKSIIDSVYIVKSCSTEFNIGLRPYLREWVTKAFEILSKGERVILETKKINKYKNGF